MMAEHPEMVTPAAPLWGTRRKPLTCNRVRVFAGLYSFSHSFIMSSLHSSPWCGFSIHGGDVKCPSSIKVHKEK